VPALDVWQRLGEDGRLLDGGRVGAHDVRMFSSM
jgi:hypothetical protein